MKHRASQFSLPATVRRRIGARLSIFALLTFLIVASSVVSAQTPANLFGAGTPTVIDGGNPTPVVLGVKIFSDVAGQVLGCSFYKAPANLGAHVVSLWDATGKLLASQVASVETASGKQSVLFSTPVSIAAKQVFTCGYFAAQGHYSYDTSALKIQKDVPPLHVPINGGLYAYGTPATTLPANASVTTSSHFWVDVLFVPSPGSTTWIGGVSVSPNGTSGASVAWNTAVASDSQVEYGPTNAYGNVTLLAPARVTAHSVALSSLQAGTTYHLRVRSRDSDSILAAGLDYSLTTGLPATILTSPGNATLSSGAKQQFTAIVSNSPNTAVTWSASAGTITTAGLFSAPSVSTATAVTVTATSQADPSVSSSAALMVNPLIPVLTVGPASLSFSGQVGTPNLAPASVSITNTGAGTLTFTGASDQPWLVLSGASGTAPATLQVSPAMSGLKAGTYTGHVTVAGGGATKSIAVVLTLTAPPVQHSVALSWKASGNVHVVTYNMYRSTMSGSSYGLLASAVGGLAYSDATVQSGATYYYVVTAVDDQGRESAYSNQSGMIIP